MPDPVRVVLLSDTHSRHSGVRVPPCDLLLHSGDVTDSGTEVELRAFIAWLAAQPARTKAFIAGNHDFICESDPALVRRLAAESGVVYLADEAATLEGLRVYGSPWTPRFFEWAFQKDRGADIRPCWQAIPDGLDLLATHGPPWGIGDETFDGRKVGCEELEEALGRARPRVHVFGHIHEAFGEPKCADHPGTLFLNAALGYTAAGGQRRPFVVEVAPGASTPAKLVAGGLCGGPQRTRSGA